MKEIGGAMKTVTAVLLLSICVLSICAFGQDKAAVAAAEAACGPNSENFTVTVGTHPMGAPEEGKALIFCA
jgi:hypothetical protein